MKKSGRFLVGLVVFSAAISFANAVDILTPGTIDSPTAITAGNYTLTAGAMTTYGSATLNGSGTDKTFGWTINGSWAEGAIYYAFSVPAGSKVALNGIFASSNMDATGAYWSEANLYKADDLSEAVVLNPGKALLNNSGYSDAVTAGGGTTQGMWDNGNGYFMYGGEADNVADALFNYSGNSDNLAANADHGVGGQPVALFGDYTGPQPADMTDFSDSTYSWGTGLQRPMKESMIAAPSNIVESNTDTQTTEYILFLKGGAQNGTSTMSYQDITLDITQLLGDANMDDLVDTADYTIWAANYSATEGGKTWAQGDLNGDGFVDTADYTLWAANYSTTPPAGGLPSSVPEPMTVSLLVLGGAALIRRRKIGN